MDESLYNQLAAKVFKQLMASLDQVDPDLLDSDSTGDMVTITAFSGEKCIVNTQRATRQIWVAGKGQGIHFTYDEAQSRWLDDKNRGLELFAFIHEAVESLSGAKL